ncbi:hypothetical protein BD560DRAFT_410925 [Blakeslea trispora]|nr:hypothetical protein BD560DRAFT_410925 [Blakeslea trispora]
MQSADIRLVYVAPSKSLALETNSLDYNTPEEQGHRNTKGIPGDYNVDMASTDRLNLDAFNNLTLSQADLDPTYDDDDEEDVESLASHLKEQKSEEPDDKSEDHVQLPSATADAMETYENITENIYCGSATGKSIAEESMPCECKYRPEKDNPDAACGDDNHCINRMMFMECMVDDCPCDRYCRNRRFQLRQYARVDVIRTEMKGFGLRALTDLPANAFIMEYIGEVIPNHEFIRRTKQYEAAGLQHYYFMTLKTDEIIDATKKGCLARFINHSCNPNCVTQKWVVGKNMRIGIFTKKAIQAGSELTFDYKFERYGAVAQPCYCGEPTCKGYIGGSLKNNHDSAKPSMVDGLDESGHIHSDDDDDEDDDEDEESDIDNSSDEESEHDHHEGFENKRRTRRGRGKSIKDEAVTLTQKKMLRKIHRRRASEPLQDPREVQSFVKRMLDSVGKSHLVIKLLQRLELTDVSSPEGKEVLKKFVRLHGLKMLKFWLGEWKSDSAILIKVLQVLSRLPLANRNGLEDCKMMELISKLEGHEDPEIQQYATQLIQSWSQLKSVYRIPKRLPTESSSKIRRRAHLTGNNEQDEVNSEVSDSFSRYDSSREFFDPDDDYFEYLSLDVTAYEIQWKMEYPPHSVIPTAPRAMMDAYLKNGHYGYARASPIWPSAYHPDDTHSIAAEESHDRSAYSSPYHKPSTTTPHALATASVSSKTKESPSSGNASPKLPLHWRYAYAEDGTIYYYNRLTGKTQWQCPEERVSSIEGVNQSDLEDLVEKAIQDTENKRKLRSESPAVSLYSGHESLKPSLVSSALARSSEQHALDENELKKEVGKIVTKYLSAKQKQLWNGDKHLFKELARKMTHHIVDREIQSSRKIQTMNSSIRTKIEKFIDTHGPDLVIKVQRKRKQRPMSKETPISDLAKFERVTPPSSLNTEVLTGSPAKRARTESIESNLMEEEDRFSTGAPSDLTPMAEPSVLSPLATKPITDTHTKGYYYSQRESSLTASNNSSRAGSPYREKNGHDSSRGGYGRSSHYYNNNHHHYNNNNNGYHRSYHHPHHHSHHYHSSPHHHYHSYHYTRHHRPRHPPSPYHRMRYNNNNDNGGNSRRSSPPPPHSHYYSRSSSRRGSLSDEDLDRRRWD